MMKVANLKKSKTAKIIIGLVLGCFVVAAFMPAIAGKKKQVMGPWKRIVTDPSGSEVYINTQTMERPKRDGGAIKVAVALVPGPDSDTLSAVKHMLKERGVDPAAYKNDYYVWELDCAKNMSRVLAVQHRGVVKDKEIIMTSNVIQDPQWGAIQAATLSVVLRRATCGY
jgi:hypothetical protein